MKYQTNYPAACNAAETLLVHASLLEGDNKFKAVAEALLDANVTLRCEQDVRSVLLASLPSEQHGKIVAATPEDFDTEFLDHIIAVKSVKDVNEAVEHINEHGSKHTDCIVTENEATSDFFTTRVDAAGCYWNASTRFADGFRYGFGAEVGVSISVYIKEEMSCHVKKMGIVGVDKQDSRPWSCRFGRFGDLQV